MLDHHVKAPEPKTTYRSMKAGCFSQLQMARVGADRAVQRPWALLSVVRSNCGHDPQNASFAIDVPLPSIAEVTQGFAEVKRSIARMREPAPKDGSPSFL